MEPGSLAIGDHVEFRNGERTETGYVTFITGWYDYEYIDIGSRPVMQNGQKSMIVDIEDSIRKVPPLE